MNYKLLLNFAMLIGEVMLENGAETSRVEDTMSRILNSSNCQTAESFVTPTGIFATLNHPDIDLMTVVKRIQKRQINLNKIAKANQLSRQYCEGTISLESAMYALKQLIDEKPYGPLINIGATGISAGTFALVLNGTLIDMGIALISGLLIGIIQHFFSRLDISKFFIDIVGGAIGASIAYLFFYYFKIGDNFDLIVISSVMPMVPGVAITNAIRDTLHGDLISGVARTMDAFIVATSIATGVGIVLSLLLI